jgi:hypothetical protein
LELRLVTCIEREFRIMAHLAMWVCKVEMLPVKKQSFVIIPTDLRSVVRY